ncbi:MAG: DUF3858 domain-containing protein [Planctomycetes bacterium]|nr:DUF3858 domain-containing protein [Planctomycetota bacterium]
MTQRPLGLRLLRGLAAVPILEFRAAALAAMTIAATTFAQAPTAIPQATTVDALELEALELKSAGRYRECSDKIGQLLVAIAADPALTPLRAARIEFLLELLSNLAVKIPDHAGVVTTVDGLAARPSFRSNPGLTALADHIAAQNLLLSGRVAEAAKRIDRLGYVRSFALLGPLDNERGSGFLRKFTPELAPSTPLDFGAPVDGKKRPVAWREIEIADVPLGDVDCGSRLEPSTQVLAYAAFSISSESERDLCLRLGTTGSVAVFVNGREVYRHEIESRPLGFDQDVCSFRVGRGKAMVLFKVCTQDGEFGFRARLTTPDGRPVDALTTTSGRFNDLRDALSNVTTIDTAPKAPTPGAIATLEARIAELDAASPAPGSLESKELGMHAFRLAYILTLRAPDEESNRRDRQYAALATQRLPSLGIAHYIHAYTLLRRGASNADREENARKRELEQAITTWPRNAEAMRALAELELETLGRTIVAADLLQRALSINPQYVNACIDRLRLLGRMDFESLRVRFVEDCLTLPELAHHPEILEFAISAAKWRGAIQEELTLLDRKLRGRYDSSTLLDIADAHVRLGNDDAAKERLEEARRNFIQIRATHEALAKFHAGRGELDEAARAWARWLELSPEDDRAYVSIAALHERAGNPDLEGEALRTALRLEPTLKKQQRRLDWIESGTQTFYEGLTIDADAIRAADPGPDADAAAAGDTHYYAFRHTIVKAYRNGTTSRYDHFLAKVLREDGANVFDTYRAPMGGGSPSARILEARVIHEDGSFERARLGNTGYADLPPIRVGDWVEVESRVDDRVRTFFGDYFGYMHLFAAPEPVPVRSARLDLILEPGRDYVFQTVGDVPAAIVQEQGGGSKRYSYRVDGISRRKTERYAPSIVERGPLLRVSTYPTWDTFAAWWWNLIRKQTQPTPDVKAKVAELVEGKVTIEQKVQAIYDFVVSDIRYEAWEFGVHGYKPYSVGSIFARRFGDCKDKAILMNAMLGEIGVESYPVLIRAEVGRDADDLTLPMVQHFNHCISYMPAQQGMPARFLDGTAQYHPMTTLPMMDRGAKVLVVRKGKAELLDIPWSDPANERDTESYVIGVEPDGNARVEYVHTPIGNASTRVRAEYGSETGRRDKKLQDDLAGSFGRIELEQTTFSDLDSLETPVRVTARFTAKELASRDGAALRLPVAFEKSNLGRITPTQQRQYDLVLRDPSSDVVEIDYVAPDGWRFAGVPQDVNVDTGVGSVRIRFEIDGQTLRIRRETTFKKARIAREDYPAFKEFTESVDRVETLDIRLEKRS